MLEGHVECPVCGGRGEQAVPGTYGPTISPEALELRQCPACKGEGEVPEATADWWARRQEEEA